MDQQIENLEISFILTRLTTIEYTTIATGEKNSIKLIQEDLNLIRGRAYRIPVNTHDSLDNHFIVKTTGKIAEQIDVRNISNGFAYIIPLVHNVRIYNGMIFGRFI